jgi:ABC-type glycerol-3-phosphate transport system substrate-binding protein
MKFKRKLTLKIALAAMLFLVACGSEKKLTSSAGTLLYGIPVNTISVKGVTEKNITTSAFWQVPVDPNLRFFKEFEKLKPELKAAPANNYRTNDIRILIQSGKRQLFVDKSGTMHEDEQFYQMNEKVNELIKSVVPDSLKAKLSYDFLVTKR